MEYIQQALQLAKRGVGTTSPNPSVGAVIVKDGVVVGEGYTQPPGQDHAEVMALKGAGERAKSATLYVSLEPCAHYGRTPPCTNSLIDAGIAEVHMAMLDPNPRVNGRGRAALEGAGMRTYVGEGEAEAREVIEAYLKYIADGLPFVTIKIAMSLDGKIATTTGDSRWITGPQARSYVHELRRTSDAVMVGIGTVLKDDPQLTARDDAGSPFEKQPVRVVVDSRGRLPLKAQLLASPGRTVLATVRLVTPRKARQLQQLRAEVASFSSQDGLVDLRWLMNWLGEREITSVLVEGGGRLWTSLLQMGLVDKVLVFVAPIIIGGRRSPTPVSGKGVALMGDALRLSRVKIAQLGEDVLITGYNR